MTAKGESDRDTGVKIGQLARQAGVSVRTIRYYEELGLLRPAKRSRGGFRIYGTANSQRLAVINFLKGMGLPLAEIRRILLAKKDIRDDRDAVRFLLEVLDRTVQSIEEKIDSLRTVKAQLENSLRILHHCQACGHEVLLDAASCRSCARLAREETVPDMLRVMMQ